MYQVKSIIEACHSDKKFNDWFNTKTAHEMLKSFEKNKKLMGSIPYDNRNNLSISLRGYYVHRVLVNAIAM